ncbi:MAG: diaminopimelate epimerase [Pirellulales bacterium]|nr:diaminopimelate epimerase [Pirellulales bacterium]
MKFTKMHGAGNDYIYIDCFSQPIPQDPQALARKMSDRHYGIGGDGLILICPSEIADAKMRMFNVDGTPGEMCGNAIRCVAKYIYDHGLAEKDRLQIISAGTVYSMDLLLENGKVDQVRVDMNDPILAAGKIPTTLPGDPVVDVPLHVDGRAIPVTCLSMGNPHCIVFVDELTDAWVRHLGPMIEVHHQFPNRTNVEFVKIQSRQNVDQRTWERGSGETLACGSGASAVCVAGVLTGRTDRNLRVHLLGGDLEIEWQESNNHVTMTGPAVEVFTGEWPDD